MKGPIWLKWGKTRWKSWLRIGWRFSPEVSPPLLSHCTHSASNLKVVNLYIIFWMASSHWNIFYSFHRSVTLIVSKICETSSSIRSSNLKWGFVFYKAVWDSLKPNQLIWLKACLPQNYYRQLMPEKFHRLVGHPFNFLSAVPQTLATTTPRKQANRRIKLFQYK